jgi:hypothetical protein
MNKIRALQMLYGYFKEHTNLPTVDICLFLSYAQLLVLIVILFTAHPGFLEQMKETLYFNSMENIKSVCTKPVKIY